MSGGAWGYKQFELERQAEQFKIILETVAKTEHIVDWAVCADTFVDEAAEELFNLWRETFERLYGTH